MKLNATFIALIPKKPGIVEIKDYHLISLVSGIYKILSKVLANRLTKVMEKLILKPQNVFVKGWRILDLVFIANKCLDGRLKLGELRLFCKLEMEKVYDHVNWRFLHYMLERCGLGMKWCTWIHHCRSEAHSLEETQLLGHREIEPKKATG